MNFGETVAYWYFRLNGFFPLMNFVLHRYGDVCADREIDMLAVRFPHVSETVGGRPEDWDEGRFKQWGLKHGQNTVCVFCEVKMGDYDRSDLAKSFDPQKMEPALNRFGVLLPLQVPDVAARFANSATIHENGTTFAKVLVGRTPTKSRTKLPYHQIGLQDAVSFIEKRFRKYRNQKNSGRVYFPNDLIQFLASKNGLNVVDKITDVDEASVEC